MFKCFEASVGGLRSASTRVYDSAATFGAIQMCFHRLTYIFTELSN